MDRDTAKMDIRQLLWTDPEPLTARHEKAARALVSVQRTLAARRPLNGGEQDFLDLFDMLAEADVDAFTTVWREPQAYYWARTAHELLGLYTSTRSVSGVASRYIEAIGATSPADALAVHLNGFGIFPVAVACHAQSFVRLPSPLAARLPLAIPASQWTIEGEGELLIHGVNQAALIVERDGREYPIPLAENESSPCPGVFAQANPVVVHQQTQLRMQPALFHLPDMDGVLEIVDTGVDYQQKYQELVRQMMIAIATYAPEVFEQFRSGMRVVALKPEGLGSTRNTTFARLPGAAALSRHGNHIALAEDLIHEFYHSRLFAIEEHHPFFDNSKVDALTDARYYSPWRRDPRPLYGIWHAAYVFSPVVRYWLRFYESFRGSPEHLQFAADRLVSLPRMLSTATGILARHADWTDFGRSLFDALCAEHEQIAREVAQLDLPDDLPGWDTTSEGGYRRQVSEIDGRELSVLEVIDEHIQLYDVAHQSAGSAAVPH